MSEPMIECFWIERANDNGLAVFRRADTGEIRPSMDSWGPGALFAETDAPEDVHVKTPDTWANLRTWTRTGDPRVPQTFSAKQSIQTHGRNPWHGFLRNGFLVWA